MTRRAGVDSDAAGAVRPLMELKSNLDITLLAAGVEKEAESRLLTGWGFHLLQGNLLSPALPAQETARAVLGEQRRREERR
jgi:EAL domain-containing protein (putative c-di-GMP-specific phosphodiesterase class I)